MSPHPPLPLCSGMLASAYKQNLARTIDVGIIALSFGIY
jgi:hypothetical protein